MQPILQNMLSAVQTGGISPEQAASLVPLVENELLDIMALGRIAASFAHVKPFTCGIINVKSGQCGENCAFCAQSAHYRTGAKTHPLVDESALFARAEQLSAAGVDRMGLVASGGTLNAGDVESLCKTAGRIVRDFGIAVCASFGMADESTMHQLRQAGFTSYHHNLETSRSFYPSICTTHSYEMRESTVRHAKAAGLRVCSGGIFGMGETWEQRFEMAEAMDRLDVDSIPVNFLTPVPGTPLGNADGPEAREGLAIIALFRLMHPRRDIVVCGGRERCLGQCTPLLFSAGANGIMVGDYLTTRGSRPEADRLVMQTLGLGESAAFAR